MSFQDKPAPQPNPVPGSSEDSALESAVMWKVSLRLLPFLFVAYVMNILDRVNVGFAKLQMLGMLGETEKIGQKVYAMGAGIFFIGYFIFEVPSNLMLKRVGARRWIARILISWGLISASMMFVVGPWSFYLLRFLLGLAEAGFFPGIILYLSYWFPARQRAKAVARFMTGSAVTGIVGNPLSGYIMEYMNNVAGLPGWQWLFLLEGLPAAALGVVALYYLTDGPELARWLTPRERDFLVERMRGEEFQRERRHGESLLQTMANPRVWLLCGLYFTVSMGANSFGLYLPTIIKASFANITDSHIGLLAAIPSIATIVGMVLVAMHSDHTGERRWHVAVPAFLAGAGWFFLARVHVLGLAPSEERWFVMAGLAVAQMGMLSMLAPFWSLPTSFLSGAAAAGGIAMINAIGNLGGFVGPNVLGQVEAATGTFSIAFMVLAGAMVFGGVLALCARHDSSLEQVHQTTNSEGTARPRTSLSADLPEGLENAVKSGPPPQSFREGNSPTIRNDEV
jgi:MFS transporter, ACS family, tartrate transporter